MRKRDERIETLKALYSIKGDGIATLKINALKDDAVFKEVIRSLSNLKINNEKTEKGNNTKPNLV